MDSTIALSILFRQISSFSLPAIDAVVYPDTHCVFGFAFDSSERNLTDWLNVSDVAERSSIRVCRADTHTDVMACALVPSSFYSQRTLMMMKGRHHEHTHGCTSREKKIIKIMSMVVGRCYQQTVSQCVNANRIMQWVSVRRRRRHRFKKVRAHSLSLLLVLLCNLPCGACVFCLDVCLLCWLDGRMAEHYDTVHAHTVSTRHSLSIITVQMTLRVTYNNSRPYCHQDTGRYHHNCASCGGVDCAVCVCLLYRLLNWGYKVRATAAADNSSDDNL